LAIQAEECTTITYRRFILSLAVGLPLVGPVLARKSRRSVADSRAPGFAVLMNAYWSLKRLPQDSAKASRFAGRDAEDRPSIGAARIQHYKELLRCHAPTAYAELFPQGRFNGKE
jgi:hypothetical protein